MLLLYLAHLQNHYFFIAVAIILFTLLCILQWLDGKEISRSDQIKALQDFPKVQQCILEQEAVYILKRTKEKELQNNAEKINEETGESPVANVLCNPDIDNALWVMNYSILLAYLE